MFYHETFTRQESVRYIQLRVRDWMNAVLEKLAGWANEVPNDVNGD